MKTYVLIILLLGTTIGWASPTRLALVIGNAEYLTVPVLQNTINDATDITARLKDIKFDVTFLKNADARTMRRGIDDFLDQVKNQVGVALIYYSGHGIQDDNHANYLLPIDATIERKSNIRSDGVSVDNILDQLNQRPEGAVSLLILDSCRNNPFAIAGDKGINRGMAPVKVPQGGVLVLYAASPGQTASDNLQERNGLFTKHLLKNLPEPGLDIEDVFEQTAIAVKEATSSQQLPYKEGNLLGKHYLVDPVAPSKSTISPVEIGDVPTLPSSPQNVETGPNAAAIEMEFWKSANSCGTLACLESYLQAYPEGNFAPLAEARITALTAATQTNGSPAVAAIPTDAPVDEPALHVIQADAEMTANVSPIEPVLTTPQGEFGHLRVHVNTVARVELDGKPVGRSVPGRPLDLPNTPVGKHRLVVSAAGYVSKEASIVVNQGAVTPVEISLVNKNRGMTETDCSGLSSLKLKCRRYR